jgi:hypothetical protein
VDPKGPESRPTADDPEWGGLTISYWSEDDPEEDWDETPWWWRTTE